LTIKVKNKTGEAEAKVSESFAHALGIFGKGFVGGVNGIIDLATHGGPDSRTEGLEAAKPGIGKRGTPNQTFHCIRCIQ
jgi:hypothetical protein